MDQYLLRPWGDFFYFSGVGAANAFYTQVKGVLCCISFYWSIFSGLDSLVMIPTLDVSFCYDI
jgi:hypothetical protein